MALCPLLLRPTISMASAGLLYTARSSMLISDPASFILYVPLLLGTEGLTVPLLLGMGERGTEVVLAHRPSAANCTAATQ